MSYYVIKDKDNMYLTNDSSIKHIFHNRQYKAFRWNNKYRAIGMTSFLHLKYPILKFRVVKVRTK